METRRNVLEIMEYGARIYEVGHVRARETLHASMNYWIINLYLLFKYS